MKKTKKPGMLLDKLAIELKRVETIAEGLEDRLMLALDGKRPPNGLRSTLEALKPFVEMARVVVKHADAFSYSDNALVFLPRGGFPERPRLQMREPREDQLGDDDLGPFFTIGHFRDALNTYDYFTKGVVPEAKPKKPEKPEKSKRREPVDCPDPECHYGAGPHTRKP